MNNFIVRKVAVLGAGVMGAQIAAHCINAKVPVILFDLPAREGPASGIALRAIEQLKKLNPAPLGCAEDANLIQAANYAEHLEWLKDCDLVIEAIAERLDWKHDLYRKVAPYLKATAIFATNTSGLSIAALSEGFEPELKARFCGVHFFNPPRYMPLVELIPTAQTRPEILDRLESFLTTSLGKSVVRAFDTPNFIANRVGIFGILATIHEAEKYGLSLDLVDELTGSRIGRAKSATFRTADVVGLDTVAHVIQTQRENLPNDPFQALYATPAILDTLIQAGHLGQKTKAGFYRKEGKNLLCFDAAKNEYVPAGTKANEGVLKMLKEKDPVKRMAALRASEHPEARFLWAIFRDAFHYVAVHLETIAETARDIDFAMRWGYGWNQGPFELWQAAGWQQVIAWVQEDIAAGEALCSAALPAWVSDGRTGVHAEAGSWSARSQNWLGRSTLPVYQRQAFRASLLGETAQSNGITVFEDEAVRLWHQNDDVLVFTLKTKMHVIGPQVIAGLERAIQEAEAGYQGLVIWNTDAHEGGAFSAGADLQAVLPLFMSGGVEAIEPVVHALQQAHLRMKYAQVPVVAAVAGLALGGGCELLLHATRRVVALESYIGLVEVGVGLIPAGGGLKEIALRTACAAQGNDLLQFLKQGFTAAAMAQVSKSAYEAQQLGYLTADDIIVMNPHELLHVARAEVRAMHAAGYRPALPHTFPVAGRYGLATIMGQLVNMREGGFISEHDQHLAQTIARILCGGDIEPGSRVDEQWLLDLERQAFMELLNHPKTQERIMAMMQTGKPLRN